ncbi:TSC-22/dip/bun family domain-containing protein [Ditylenchus destructor]|nr:TSC-22/dip/bun family domain-containing protein [Ditylenchus destructor]
MKSASLVHANSVKNSTGNSNWKYGSKNGPPPQIAARLIPVPIRRRHSLAPENMSVPAGMSPPQPPVPPRMLLTRNRRSFNFSSSINGAGGAGTTPSSQNAQIVAIDSKIEQAMDLVKTHLMFAVREEVESLRNKILELETTVVQLEAENSILREHVPSDILQNLALHSSSNGSGSSASTLMAAQ